MAAKNTDSAPASAEAAAPVPRSGGGLGAWLPLIIVFVTMPALAFVTTKFLLVPQLQSAVAHARAPEAAPAGGEGGEKAGEHGEKPADHAPAPGAAAKAHPGPAKYNATLGKIIVNVSGTAGTRYLMSNFTLVSSSPNFKSVLDTHKEQLTDLAIGALGSKTIADLEKPGARNQIRSELISMFNNALGAPIVKEIFFTEFAIQ